MSRDVKTVSEVNQIVKNMFSKEYALRTIFVKGEITNCKYHSTGHIYFSVKDSFSQLSCVMFRSDALRGLDFRLEDGKEVIIGGTVDAYEASGRYQLYAKKIVLAGDGALEEKFRMLQQKLEKLGYFDEDRKLPLPRFVKRVGIVTAKSGAAIHDIIDTANRINPYVKLVLKPAKVQGDGAAQSIAKAIKYLDEKDDCEVIIVGRGGGSREDLWAFNEEEVAKAIYECRKPIVSAVGHEVDVSISDYVADVKAATPTAAAQLVIYDPFALQKDLSDKLLYMKSMLDNRISLYRGKMSFYERQLRAYSPDNILNKNRQRVLDLEDALERIMDAKLKEAKYKLGICAGKLDAVNSLKNLESGYSYVRTSEGKMVNSVNKVAIDDEIELCFVDGTVKARVFEKSEEKTWN